MRFSKPIRSNRFGTLLAIAALAAIIVMPASAGAHTFMSGHTHAIQPSRPVLPHVVPHAVSPHAVTCHLRFCFASLSVNPALLSGGALPCPAIQKASATILVTNRAADGGLKDEMTLYGFGLPPNTGFDLFTVQNTPLDTNTQFSGFGFGWYQSDVQSDSAGRIVVNVEGVFDVETFIENPSAPFTPIHTYNVGIWFDSPTAQQAVCGYAGPPAKTPFNGQQNAGTLAMITAHEPLSQIG